MQHSVLLIGEVIGGLEDIAEPVRGDGDSNVSVGIQSDDGVKLVGEVAIAGLLCRVSRLAGACLIDWCSVRGLAVDWRSICGLARLRVIAASHVL